MEMDELAKFLQRKVSDVEAVLAIGAGFKSKDYQNGRLAAYKDVLAVLESERLRAFQARLSDNARKALDAVTAGLPGATVRVEYDPEQDEGARKS